MSRIAIVISIYVIVCHATVQAVSRGFPQRRPWFYTGSGHEDIGTAAGFPYQLLYTSYSWLSGLSSPPANTKTRLSACV
jgi:hypothetical protein